MNTINITFETNLKKDEFALEIQRGIHHLEGVVWKINSSTNNMNATNKIIDFAKALDEESTNLIKKYDEFNEYIKPLFLNKFGHKYEPSLHSMYQGEKRIFLDIQKNKQLKNTNK
jgi:hypothetical protein